MRFRMLGSRIEYLQAAKRLEEINNALPGTSLAEEQKELIKLFRDFEREVNNPGKKTHSNKSKRTQ